MSTDFGRENKRLAIILGVLTVIIIGLVVGIIVVRINSENKGDEADYYGNFVMSEEQDKEFEAFQQVFDEVSQKAQEKITGEAVEADVIMEVYSPTINKYMANNDYSNAQTFILTRHEMLVKYGHKQKAMEALMALDYSMIPEHIQNRYYKRIVELAKELGETEIEKEYQALVDKTAKAAEEAGEASREFTEKMMNETGPYMKKRETQ